MNGNRYSQQWLHDVDHKRDWYDPHWQPQYKTEINKQVYRFTGKEPWYGWKSWLIMGLLFPNRWTIGIAITAVAIWWVLNKW